MRNKLYIPTIINKLRLGLIGFHNCYPQFDCKTLYECLSYLKSIEDRISYGSNIQWEKSISELIKLSPKKTITFNQIFPTNNNKIYKKKILDILP